MISLYVLLSCGALTGCIVAPIPMTKRVEVPGPASQTRAPDLTFLHAGQISRDEVSKALASVDTGYDREDVFFGRWVSSGSGWIWLIAGDNNAAGGYWRNWRVHNVLVTFDSNGVARRLNQVDDKQLLKIAAGLPPSQAYSGDFSIPIELYVRHALQRPVELRLKADSVTLDHPDHPKIYLHLAPQEVSRLKLIRCHHPNPGSLQLRMDLRHNTIMGRRLVFNITPADLLRLTKFLQTANPAALH